MLLILLDRENNFLSDVPSALELSLFRLANGPRPYNNSNWTAVKCSVVDERMLLR